jgi:hypothetical protein
MSALAGMRILALLASLWLLLAPLPRGIALNLETQECAGYWGGDEYASTVLPEGWVAYYPGNDRIIETPVGSCTYASTGEYEAAENCCRQLGYEYAGPQIGESRASPLVYIGMGMYLLKACGTCLAVLLVAALVFGVGFFLVRWIRRRRQRAQSAAPIPADHREDHDV